MSDQSTEKNLTQKIGIVLFSIAIACFIGSLTMSHYVLDVNTVKEGLNNEYFSTFVEQNKSMMEGQEYPTSFAFLDAFDEMMSKVQTDIKTDLKDNKGLSGSEYWSSVLQDWQVEKLALPVTQASSTGFLPGNTWIVFFLTFILGIIGALMYILPKRRLHEGIKNNHIFQSSMHNRGWLGIAAGIFLISFYILLYFNPEHMVNWIILVDPISEALRNKPADNWFLYGLLYTVAILIMGIRMIIKYRHNTYQMVRTGSVMFFQTTFAFMLPNLMAFLNKPEVDLKNIWPLDYSFFFDYRLDKMADSGNFGLFLLVWGIILAVVAVPVITYFFGKRWYCSWVCGCGGLAETLGDPYRQLSDKSVQAWQIERWTIHAVLVFAVVMTVIVLYGYLPLASEIDTIWNKTNFVGLVTLLLIAVPAYVHRRNLKVNVFQPNTMVFMWIAAIGVIVLLNYNHFILENYKAVVKINRWLFIALAAAIIGALALSHRKEHKDINPTKIYRIAFLFLAVIVGWQVMGYLDTEKTMLTYNTSQVRSIYAFSISSVFAGVVGTGFYPLMGNRVWCRFGCPLAAYLGLIQRLKSRFRITTNGGQCISCGNCSTYCEMGIDVRAYAQKGQDIVRSSCVGCGICSAVCPRGVLRLENGTVDLDMRTEDMRVIHVSENEVRLLG